MQGYKLELPKNLEFWTINDELIQNNLIFESHY